MRKLLTVLLAGLIAFPSPALLATCGGGGGGGGGAQKSYKTTWTRFEQAKVDAEKARYGILLYFPPTRGDKEEHSLFQTKPVSEHSTKSPMVKIAGERHVKVREEFAVRDQLHSILVTDWFGNPMTPKPFVAKSSKDKLPLKRILATIKSAERFVDKTKVTLDKKVKKGERAFEKERWREALKEYLPVAELKGFQASDKARQRVEEIVEEGEKQLEKAKRLPADEAKRELRAISREFKGTTVQEAAEKALAELSGTAFEWRPEPREAEDFWNEFRSTFSWESLDATALAHDLEVQKRVVDGARAEREHRYDDANELYEEAVSLDPDDAVARRYLGEFHRHHSGNWALARTHFEVLLSIANADAYSRAIAMHGLGKMTIHGGEFAKGVAMIEKSIAICPTQLAHRNLAVYWFSENEVERAREHVRSAVALDPLDPYTRVFEAVYMAERGDHEGALKQIAETPFDLSMSYNVACVYSHMRDKEKSLHHLARHFNEYEFTDAVRSKEMWEARTDANFKWLHTDDDFLAVTHLAVDETGGSDSR